MTPTIRATDAQLTSEVLVLGLRKDEKKKLSIQTSGIRFNTASILEALDDMGATGASDEVIKLPGESTKLILLTGLGAGEITHEVLRRAAGAAARSLLGQKSATFALPHKSREEAAAIAEGALLGSYAFDEFRGATKPDRKSPLAKIELHTNFAKDKKLQEALQRAEVISKYSHLVRDLVNTPPSHLNPVSFCAKFQPLAKKLSLKVEVLSEQQLKKLGYGGIIGVGQGSANPPRLLHISYRPKGAKKRLAYVGKGITFDTGGLALKPAQGMEAMKSDMSGAAAVSAAILAIAELKVPIEIDAWAPLAENMVSDTATRPSDIITIYGGKTVEVLNPDAEGRLILADALVKAAEVGNRNGKLDGIVDVATLTGAQVVALGTRTSAVMTNNENFRDRFLETVNRTGEQFWPMPLPEELRASLDSPVADIANIGERMGGMLVAGLFLKDFISPDLPWLHLDIAGPAYNESKPHGYTTVGGTGVALRTLLAFAEDVAGR
ncbi:MAG: leucyl aminopeptidase [Actinobacteria bacterium]|nr:leucyl aminopeptidase [Actinomycetota bacterium]